MKRDRACITVAAVARRADVSRTFLYQNSEARQLIRGGADDVSQARARAHEERTAQIETTWRERALNAEDALAAANREIVQQRHTIAELLGRIRDLEADLPEDGVPRLLAENATLKQQVRDLTTDARGLQERLHSARENNRFLDNRIANLEAELDARDRQRG
ncbi:MAG TPA: hypothetical protein VIW24_26575 [Aldersonia sp.]